MDFFICLPVQWKDVTKWNSPSNIQLWLFSVFPDLCLLRGKYFFSMWPPKPPRSRSCVALILKVWRKLCLHRKITCWQIFRHLHVFSKASLSHTNTQRFLYYTCTLLLVCFLETWKYAVICFAKYFIKCQHLYWVGLYSITWTEGAG